MVDGALTFVSWVRRGLATGFANEDGSPAPPVVSVSVQFNDDPIDTVTARLNLIGPGDIVGLDSSVIVRTWPKADDLDAESVAYALIEFDQADLPWRYTSAKFSGDVANQSDHLRAWFSLLVLEASEASIAPSTPERKLPTLTVPDPSVLPEPLQMWAWAHTQFEGSEIDESLAASKITGAPGLFTARLMSPRLLQANKEYTAYLVPTFEQGRRVGLGLDLEGVESSAAAWDPKASGSVELPVYFSWRFRTGSIANFEQAARLIKPFVLPPTMGSRDMDVSDPGQELPEAQDGSLPVEGALMSVAAFEQGTPEWNEPERGAFIEALKPLVNAPADAVDGAEDPVVAPPLYGQWYAADDRLNEPRPAAGATNPPWFHELNSDPRTRVGAALGTKVIQNEQQALLAGGWDQVEEIKDINDKLRVLQLGREVLTRLHVRHVLTASDHRFYHLTARVHARVLCGDKTVCKRIDESPILPRFFSPQWRRLSSPLGALGRVQRRAELPPGFLSDLLQQLNGCRGPAPEPEPPGGLHDPRDNPMPGGPSCDIIETLIELGPDVLLHWGLAILWVGRRLLVTEFGECWWVGLRALRFGIVLIQIATNPEDVRRRCRWRNGTLSLQDVLGSAPMSVFDAFPGISLPLPQPKAPSGTADNTIAAAIRAALAQVLEALTPPPPVECPEPMDLEQCRISLQTTLHPKITVGRGFLERRSLHPSVQWTPVDPLEPMLVFPEYERPMYEPLKDISTDWILPGLNQMKRDTVGLAVMNQKFIEAYMTGLNHEMTRELLWNEFPTDQRGTYFRQFWSIASHMLENGTTLPAESLHDILPLRQWPKLAKLGENSPRISSSPGLPFLVLVVRAQLIQKYPNVIVYAQDIDASGQTLTGVQRFPIFDALIAPDVAFYGFDLTAEQVRDNDRLFFVLQEQPGEPKFGDTATDRDAQIYTTDLTQFGDSAGTIAQETFLQPFRLGIQGKVLLPPPPEE